MGWGINAIVILIAIVVGAQSLWLIITGMLGKTISGGIRKGALGEGTIGGAIGESIGGWAGNTRLAKKFKNKLGLQEERVISENVAEGQSLTKLEEASDTIGTAIGAIEGATSAAKKKQAAESGISKITRSIRAAKQKLRSTERRSTLRQETGMAAIIKQLKDLGETSKISDIETIENNIIALHKDAGDALQDAIDALPGIDRSSAATVVTGLRTVNDYVTNAITMIEGSITQLNDIELIIKEFQ
jgi:hypothetical protein